MRYCRFQTMHGSHYGKVESVDGNDVITQLLAPWPEDAAATWKLSEKFTPLPLSEAHLMSPVVPKKIICVGRNYKDHASELGSEVPKEPLIFYKPVSSIIAPGATVQLPPAALTKRV